MLYRLGFCKLNTVDLYEAKPVICLENEKRCSILRSQRITSIDRYDILNLVISSIADYLAVLLKQMSLSKALYTIAKRVLTVLYALELYEGLNPPSFIEAPRFAEKVKIVSRADLPLLEICARIKSNKTGDTYSQYASHTFIRVLTSLFEKYAYVFLSHFSRSELSVENLAEIITLLRKKYKLSWKAYLAHIFIYLLLYFVSKCSTRDRSRKILTRLTTLLRYRMKFEDILRLLILGYMLIILNFGKEKINRDPIFKATGVRLVDYWYEYMV